ncbi:hypothetical protein Daus18300_002834 [Diaporthe australafricana]|uniref:Uncharacterized protein n=1 Tax=Diaporthe australafricana TaxID=127596 RepID=A0ABR3XKE2_9PEZI
MKVMFIAPALVAAVAALTAPEAAPFTLSYQLRANATEVLAANGINVTAFATNDFSIDGVNFTKKSEKFAELDIDINDLVSVRIVEHGTVASEKDDNCHKCHLCSEACVSTVLFWPICAALCLATPICKQCNVIG